MLNDLFTIERGLTAHGIDLVACHPDIKDIAKGRALLVRLRADGSIASVEIVQEAGRGALWTLRDGQHNGFPGLKTAAGLLSLTDKARAAHQLAWEDDKTPEARRSALSRLLDNNPLDSSQVRSWPSTGHRKRIAERLEGLRPLADDPLTAAVPAAFGRFLAALGASPSFLEQLMANLAMRAREREADWLDSVHAALTGPVMLAIDVADDEFERDATDPRQIEPVSSALSGPAPGDSDAKEFATVCALSGKTAKLHAGNFPQPNLPGLGQTYIFSRNRDIPSLTRYGRTADASFPIDSQLVRRLSGTITKLTGEAAKGRTWRLVPAEAGDKPDLLVVGMTDPGARLADAFADEDEVAGEAALNELGSRALDQSRGIHQHDHPSEGVTVLVLRTVDPANRKAIYHRRATLVELWKAAQRWQAATSNTPDWLGFPFPVKGRSEATIRRPPYVAPLSITPLSRIEFANGGRRRVDVIGATAATAFGLFLREGDVERDASRLLRLLIRRHGALFGGLAAARAKGIEHLRDFDPKADLRRDALRSTTWIGVLLHHLGRAKESYMSDVGFRLGQLLAVADIVHVGYCLDVRKGSIPPSLLGNALLGIAAANPLKALELLCRRWPPYAAWAANSANIFTEAAKPDKNKSRALKDAFFGAQRVRPIAAEIHDDLQALRDRPDDAFRAELLLGYMAGLPVSKKAYDPSTKTSDDSADQDMEEQG